MTEQIGCRGRTPRLRRAALACLATFALGACGDAKSPAQVEPSDAEKLASGYTELNGFLVPPRQIPDPSLPDSCTLLIEADPKGMIQEPLAPIERMSNVCIAYAESTPTLGRSLAVELRHPEPVEIESGGVPTSKEAFWTAEGGSVDLMGGKQEQIEDIAGIGDYAVWYPITDGIGLHTYWQGRYIVRITVRGLAPEASLEWAKKVAGRAIEASANTGQSSAESAPPAPGN